MELSPCIPNQWINIASTRLEKGASSYFRAKKVSIRAGDRAPWADWREFAWKIIAAFSAIIEEEQARKYSLQKLQLLIFMERRVGATYVFPEELALTFRNFSIFGQS